jgi:hypothetical protein
MKIQDESVNDVLVHLRTRYNDDLPHFSDCIRSAFDYVDAVFWRERYLAFYWKCVTTVPGYIENVVTSNAVAESAGSKGLYDLWTLVRDSSQIEEGIKSHFRDESRHSRLFLHLAKLAFPNYLTDAQYENERKNLFDSTTAPLIKNERVAGIEYLLDNLIQMNIGEIRTRAHMFMIGPVLTALSPRGNQEKVDGILSGLVFDEVTHIGYTAQLMEEFCRSGHKALISELYKRRLRDFNSYTIEQTRQSIELYGNGEYPDLLEI